MEAARGERPVLGRGGLVRGGFWGGEKGLGEGGRGRREGGLQMLPRQTKRTERGAVEGGGGAVVVMVGR